MKKIKLPKAIKTKLRIALLASLGLVVVVLASSAGWFYYNLRPVDPTQTDSVNFSLPQGQKTTEIAKRLEDQGLIRSSSAFLVYISLKGARSQLQAGNYTLSPSLSARNVTAILTQGRVQTNLLVVAEGKKLSQIIELAAAKGIDREEMKAALAAKYDHDFLAGKPKGTSLEGYLFPDSYDVNENTTAASLVKNMLDNFGSKVPDKYTTEFKKKGLSLHEGLTLASIIEREVNTDTDRPMVAQVFLKRLRIGLALESDVTVDYAAALLKTTFNTGLDSRYNTYKYPGLPTGPIANPGLSALDAVVHPAKTDYLYFVTGKDKITHFATDFSGHERNIAKFGVLAE